MRSALPSPTTRAMASLQCKKMKGDGGVERPVCWAERLALDGLLG
jgi:hypothetical protein